MMKKQMPDRRRSTDRRSARRFTVTIDIEWEYSGERHPGTISDLSEGGCFVLTGVEVQDNDEVGLFLPIGDGMKVQYIGTITNTSARSGLLRDSHACLRLSGTYCGVICSEKTGLRLISCG